MRSPSSPADLVILTDQDCRRQAPVLCQVDEFIRRLLKSSIWGTILHQDAHDAVLCSVRPIRKTSACERRSASAKIEEHTDPVHNGDIFAQSSGEQPALNFCLARQVPPGPQDVSGR